MARIKCKVPSTGYTKNYTACKLDDRIVNNVLVPGITTNLLSTEWGTLMEAPDYSVPDTRLIYTARDPSDPSRAIRPGETFIMTPIFARNNSDSDEYQVFTELVLEDGTVIPCPGKQIIPAGDTVMIPVQGRSLLKRNKDSAFGDRLRLRSNAAGVIYVWGSGEEKLSAEHTGIII